MILVSYILLALLAQDSPLPPLSTAIVRAGGHTYQLYCAQVGELMVASETGVCEKTDAGGVERFEIRNEDGDAQFAKDAPEGNAFRYVAIFSQINGGRQLIDVDTSHDDGPGGGPKSSHVHYYLDALPTGLDAFGPPLMGVDGFAQLSGGAALSRTFDTGFFQFSILLGFDTLRHRIDIQPEQTAFSAFPPRGRQKPAPSAASGEIVLYSSHDSNASKTPVRILPGHVVTWWESLDPIEKPAGGQVVQILAAWAPATLKPADNAPEGVRMVYYDWNNLWLQIEVDGRTGWIRETGSFRKIGLEMPGVAH